MIATHAETPTPAHVLTLLQAIERHPPGAPAALAFRSALRRAGREADASGGLATLNEMPRVIAAVDPGRADARTAIIRAAWAEILPGPGMERR